VLARGKCWLEVSALQSFPSWILFWRCYAQTVWYDCVLPAWYDYLPEQERPIFYPDTRVPRLRHGTSISGTSEGFRTTWTFRSMVFPISVPDQDPDLRHKPGPRYWTRITSQAPPNQKQPLESVPHIRRDATRESSCLSAVCTLHLCMQTGFQHCTRMRSPRQGRSPRAVDLQMFHF